MGQHLHRSGVLAAVGYNDAVSYTHLDVYKRQSLYDLAAEEGLEARILGELDEAVALFKANPDYLHLLSTPSIPKRERCGLLDEALRDLSLIHI